MNSYRHALNNQIVADTKSFWKAEREERKLNDKKNNNNTNNINSTNTTTNIILDKKQ